MSVDWGLLGTKIRDYLAAQLTDYREIYLLEDQMMHVLFQGHTEKYIIISFAGGDILDLTGAERSTLSYNIKVYIPRTWKKGISVISGTKFDYLADELQRIYDLLNHNTQIPDYQGICYAKVTSILPSGATFQQLGINQKYNGNAGLSIEYLVEST